MASPDTNRSLIDALVQRVIDDRTHGASELARIALNALQEFIESAPVRDLHRLHQDTMTLVTRLQQARPSMTVLHNLLQQWRTLAEASHPTDAGQFIAQAIGSAQQLVAVSVAATAQAADHAAQLVSAQQTLLTHSYSSTVSTLFKQLSAQHVNYIVTESAPGREGERLAHELARASLAFDYITEAQAGMFMPRADFVFVGADTLLADGSVVNKAGTLLIALAAREFHVPFYVCCESFKQSSLAATEITLEAMSSAEIHLQDMPGMTRHNIYFDVTPAHLVSGWITEQGLRSNPNGPATDSTEGNES